MKGKWILTAMLIAETAALAFLLLPGRKTAAPPPSEESAAPTEAEAAPFDEALTLRVETENGVLEMSLHDYLTGVVLAEMPSEFAPEALKAQAVASRTYALRKAETGKHENADVCGSYACCQAWTPKEECTDAAALQKAEQAVRETDGLVVTYEGALIDATFFSCADGMTESALAVWGSDVPYLQTVESPEHVEKYEESPYFTAEEFRAILHSAYPDAALDGSPETWLGEQTRTAGGGLDTAQIGGVTVRGTELRSLFRLRSTEMTLTPDGDGVRISTEGYGHRVGMSQYGANELAREGKRFEDILLHYYQGTQIEQLQLEE